jgi:hypothetical protein
MGLNPGNINSPMLNCKMWLDWYLLDQQSVISTIGNFNPEQIKVSFYYLWKSVGVYDMGLGSFRSDFWADTPNSTYEFYERNYNDITTELVLGLDYYLNDGTNHTQSNNQL